MTAREIKIKTFSLIEELYPEKKGLADDQDILHKINGVINQIMLDLMRYKKIPAKYEYTITDEEEKTLILTNIPDFYKLNKISSIEYEIMGDLEIVFDIENRSLPLDVNIYYYKFPELMQLEFQSDDAKENYDKNFEIELSLELIEIMPYGIAADLLKNDMISNYGQYFYNRYTDMLNKIDPRLTDSFAKITGGCDI